MNAIPVKKHLVDGVEMPIGYSSIEDYLKVLKINLKMMQKILKSTNI